MTVSTPAAGHAYPAYPASRDREPAAREVALVDLLDRLLAGGVVITGTVTLSIADVDLVQVSLNAVITSVRAAAPDSWETGDPQTTGDAREGGDPRETGGSWEAGGP